MSHLYSLLLLMVLLQEQSVAGHGGHGESNRHRKGGPGQMHQHTHKHYMPERPKGQDQPERLVKDTQLLRDEEHLKEELPEYIDADKLANMSPEELEYHYFKIHDFDNNYKLDGLEILSAISHIVVYDDGSDDVPADPEVASARREFLRKKRESEFGYYIEMIDRLLEDDDSNKDGYLSYSEYVASRRS